MDSHEIDLIRRAQAGEHAAFEALVRRHDRRVLQVAYGILGNRDDAYDAYQNTFIKAFTRIRAFRFESAFGTWLIRIAINQSINLRKRRRWDRRRPLDTLYDTPQATGTTTSPDETLINTELSEQIRESMALLSARERSVFVLKHLHGYKIREIAPMIDCAEGTVKNYLFRATQKMRHALQPLVE